MPCKCKCLHGKREEGGGGETLPRLSVMGQDHTDQTSPESLELDLGELLTLCPGCGLPCRRTEAGRADCDCHKPTVNVPDWVLEVDGGPLWEQRKSLRASLAAEQEAFSRRMFAQGKQ